MSIAVIVESFSSTNAKEIIDFILGLSVYNEELYIEFRSNSLKYLLKDYEYDYSQVGGRNISKLLNLFELYDVDNIFVDKENLKKYSYNKKMLHDYIKVVDSLELQERLRNAKHKFMLQGYIEIIHVVSTSPLKSDCLEKCLNALEPLRQAIPCELVIADTGSTDKTKEIAEKYADILFDFKWVNDFSKARNAVMDKCSGKWYLTVDAD